MIFLLCLECCEQGNKNEIFERRLEKKRKKQENIKNIKN